MASYAAVAGGGPSGPAHGHGYGQVPPGPAQAEDAALPQHLAASVVPQVATLLQRWPELRFCDVPPKIDHIRSSSPNEPANSGDRFRLDLTSLGRDMSWEVLLSADNPRQTPDFIFHTDPEFLPPLAKLTELTAWDPTKPDSLFRVVAQLLEVHRDYQRQRLLNHPSSLIRYEIASLDSLVADSSSAAPEKSASPPFAYEVMTLYRENVPLDMCPVLVKAVMVGTHASLPEGLLRRTLQLHPPELEVLFLLDEADGDVEDAGQDDAAGRVSVTTTLTLAPAVERLVGRLQAVGWHPQVYLLEYLRVSANALTHEALLLHDRIMRRRLCLAAFTQRFSGDSAHAPYFDSETFSKLTLLLEIEHFLAFLHIELPHQFLDDDSTNKPILRLQSVFHFAHGKPVTEDISDYPYSPRWSYTELADRVYAVMFERVLAFKQLSLQLAVSDD